jgi:hypothetical protein
MPSTERRSSRSSVILRRIYVLGFCLALTFARCVVVSAQTFVGGGTLVGAGGATPLSFSSAATAPCSGLGPLVEAGAFFSRYVGAGIEFVRCGTVNDDFSFSTFQHTHTYRQVTEDSETIITATLRLRVKPSERFEIHFVGGAGVIHSDPMITDYDTDSLTGVTTTTAMYREDVAKLAVVGGVEGVIKLTTHLSIVPTLRVYNLRRPHPYPFNQRSEPRVTEWTAAFSGAVIRLSW